MYVVVEVVVDVAAEARLHGLVLSAAESHSTADPDLVDGVAAFELVAGWTRC